MKTKSLFTALIFIALTSLLSAQNQNNATQQQGTVPVPGAYIDGNNNGPCDNYEAYGPGRGYGRGAGYGRGNGFRGGRGPANNQSIAYRQGLPQGQGRGFGPANGRGLGPGRGRGLAPGGRRFVDTDKDGVCDLYETSVKKN